MLSHDYVADGKFWTAGQIIGNNNMPRCYGGQPALAYRLIISCKDQKNEREKNKKRARARFKHDAQPCHRSKQPFLCLGTEGLASKSDGHQQSYLMRTDAPRMARQALHSWSSGNSRSFRLNAYSFSVHQLEDARASFFERRPASLRLGSPDLPTAAACASQVPRASLNLPRGGCRATVL